MKFSVSIETNTSIRLHSGMPKNLVTGKEFLKLCVTCNDRLWTENKAYCLGLLIPLLLHAAAFGVSNTTNYLRKVIPSNGSMTTYSFPGQLADGQVGRPDSEMSIK
jgi:hypothetical protein